MGHIPRYTFTMERDGGYSRAMIWWRYSLMYRIIYLVFIWKRSVFGFWYRAPKLRMAHVDRAAAGRLGRLFTFEDMMGVPRSAQ